MKRLNIHVSVLWYTWAVILKKKSELSNWPATLPKIWELLFTILQKQLIGYKTLSWEICHTLYFDLVCLLWVFFHIQMLCCSGFHVNMKGHVEESSRSCK